MFKIHPQFPSPYTLELMAAGELSPDQCIQFIQQLETFPDWQSRLENYFTQDQIPPYEVFLKRTHWNRIK